MQVFLVQKLLKTDRPSSVILYSWTHLLRFLYLFLSCSLSRKVLNLPSFSHFFYTFPIAWNNFLHVSSNMLSNYACDLDPQSFPTFLSYWKISINILSIDKYSILSILKLQTSALSLKTLLWLFHSALHKGLLQAHFHQLLYHVALEMCKDSVVTIKLFKMKTHCTMATTEKHYLSKLYA